MTHRKFRKLAIGVMAASLIAASVPGHAQPAGFKAEDKADALCLMIFSSALGAPSDGEISAEETQGLISIVTYFTGKVKGRHPMLQITELLSPSYVLMLQGEMASSVKRCSDEAIQMGTDLETAGKILTEAGASQPAS